MTLKVSIIIPCRNEKNYIESCLNSILEQNYSNVEIIVCDGMSDDGTREILEIFHKNNQIIFLDNLKKTTPYAVNIGLKEAKGDVIITYGAHAIMLPNYITNALNILKKDLQVGCVGGIITNINENKTTEIISKSMSSTFGVGNAYFRTGTKSGYVDTVAFGAFRKEVFEKVGFFDEELTRNQDDEFNFRLIKSGYKIFLSPDIQSKYYVRASYLKLFKQYFQYGYWKVYVNKKHKTITTIRQLIPLFFLVYILSIISTSLLFPKLTIHLSVLLIVYLILALISAIKLTKHPSKIISIIWCFIILHISYGLGYLKGIINFLMLNRSINLDEKLTR